MVDLDDDKSPVQGYIDGIEWEPLAQEFEGSVVRVSGVEGDFGNLNLRRNAEYGFDVSLESKGGADWADERLRAAVPGTMSEGVKIEVAASDGRLLVLPNASLTHVNHRSTPKGETSTVKFYAYKAAWSTRDSDRKPSLLVDWFIGGPESDSVASWRLTNRDHGASYTRTRAGMRAELTEHKFASDVPPAATSKASSRDYLTLHLPNGSVRLCQVPKPYGPRDARPFALEYDLAADEPSEDLRQGVIESLGFLFGRHMLRVGTTVCDPAGYVLREEANSPWGHDAMRNARQPDRPVMSFFDWNRRNETESVLSSATGAYLAVRDELNLSHAVWTMWMAARMAVSFETPLYAAALEALMKGWFASNRSKTKAVYMPVEDFRKIFAEAINKFQTTAKGIEYGDRIVRKISAANAMGVNERFDVFFEEIGLPVAEGEAAVIQSRNISAHGTKSERDPHELVALGAGYRTLLNRVILKLLGFSGQYIDYSTVGHPVRSLDEPIGYRPTRNVEGV